MPITATKTPDGKTLWHAAAHLYLVTFRAKGRRRFTLIQVSWIGAGDAAKRAIPTYRKSIRKFAREHCRNARDKAWWMRCCRARVVKIVDDTAEREEKRKRFVAAKLAEIEAPLTSPPRVALLVLPR